MRKKIKINPNNKYRMSSHTAKHLGLKINKEGRYYLNKENLKKYLDLEQYKIKRLFYDIETSQYEVKSFRIGYNLSLHYANVTKLAKIICVSWKWEGEDKIHNIHWGKEMDDKRILQEFIPVLNKADELVAHNGDRFDIKWLRTRALFHRLPMKPKYRSVDTLKQSKAYFNFPNNRLDTIAQYLGVGAKISHQGIKMWDKVEAGDKKALKAMVQYCDGDITVLEDVYYQLEKYVKNMTHVGAHTGGSKHSCPSCGNNNDIVLNKFNYTALGTIKPEMSCESCGYVYEMSYSAYRDFMMVKTLLIN